MRSAPAPIARSVLLDAFAVEVMDALRDVGIPSLLVKGPVMARWLYRDGARPYGDINLLVPPWGRAEADRAMSGLGFETRFQRWARWERAGVVDVPWTRSGALSVRVNLHSAFKGVGVSDEVFWEALSSASEPMRLVGGYARIPSEPARALILALHAVADASGQARRDLARAIGIVERSAWQEAAALAAQLDALPAFSAGVRLDARGDAIAASLRLPDETTPEIELLLSNVAVSHGLTQLAAARGARAKLALLARELIPTRAFMATWRRSDRPREGFAVLAAYPWRAAWLVLHVPRALVVWGRARRNAR